MFYCTESVSRYPPTHLPTHFGFEKIPTKNTTTVIWDDHLFMIMFVFDNLSDLNVLKLYLCIAFIITLSDKILVFVIEEHYYF